MLWLLSQGFFISFFVFVCYFLYSPIISLKFLKIFRSLLLGLGLFVSVAVCSILTLDQVFACFMFWLFAQVFILLLGSYTPLAQFKQLAFILSCGLFLISLVLVGKFSIVASASVSSGFLSVVTVS